MSEIKSEVYCNVVVEGLHNWPSCPFDEVGYLRDLHRHEFHITAFVAVNHDDRDTEFIMLKHLIKEYLNQEYWHDEYKCLCFNAMSCEMIARELIEKFKLTKCIVSEDNENGAVLSFT